MGNDEFGSIQSFLIFIPFSSFIPSYFYLNVQNLFSAPNDNIFDIRNGSFSDIVLNGLQYDSSHSHTSTGSVSRLFQKAYSTCIFARPSNMQSSNPLGN